jgi:hypothetical protein
LHLAQWKVAEILILKPGKSNELTSYLPTSLLPTASKGFEKLLSKRLHPMVENNGLIPNHQFSFRQRHSITEQTHQIVLINEALENEQYCSATFLGISHAFNEVWRTGLLYKLGLSLLLNYFLVLNSCLHNRCFLVKAETEHAELPSQCWRTPMKCPKAIIIPIIHCRPTNLTRIHHRQPLPTILQY